MKKMQAPTPDRKGKIVILDVPDRRVQHHLDQGWKVVVKTPETEVQEEKKEFNLSGENWFTVRGKVKEELQLEKAPVSKEQAKDFLEQAGYVVR